MQLHEIREARAAKVAEARSLLAAANGANLTPEQQSKFDAIKGEITSLESQEQRQQFIEDAERRSMGQPVDKPRQDMEGQVNVLGAIRCQIENRAATGALAEFQVEAKRMGIEARNGGILVPTSIFEKRATMTTTGAAAVVPDDYRADQFIGLLRNSMIVRQLGARVLTGLRGDTVLPKATGAATAYWVAEGDSLTESNTTYSSIKLEPKTVGALTAFSRNLALQSNPSIEALLRDDISAVVGLAVDKALIHGTAAAKQPVGILNVSGIQTANLATLSWATIVAMLEKLGLENITPNAVLTHAKAATKLQTTLKDASAGSVYLMDGGRVAGLPAYVTNQLDAKTGTPDKGRVIAGDFSQIVIGEWGVTEILANPYATGYYEKGDVQLRIMHTMDAVVRQTPQLIELAELNKLGLPTASNRKRLTLKGDFEGWSVSTSETEWTNYLEAYGITAAPYPSNSHVLYLYAHEGLQVVVPALAFMRAFFKPSAYVLERMFCPANVDAMSFVVHEHGIPTVVIDDSELGWRVRAVQSGVNKESCIRWLQLSRSARAMAQSVHLLAAKGLLGFCMPCGQHRMVLHGMQKGHVLFVNHVSMVDVLCDASDSITGTREQYIFHEAAKQVRQPLATTTDYQVPMHLDGSTATTNAEWQVLSGILKAKENRRVRHCESPRV